MAMANGLKTNTNVVMLPVVCKDWDPLRTIRRGLYELAYVTFLPEARLHLGTHRKTSAVATTGVVLASEVQPGPHQAFDMPSMGLVFSPFLPSPAEAMQVPIIFTGR